MCEKEKYSTNELAEKIVGKRIIEKGTIIFDAPFELGYHCPKCKYIPIIEGEYDERLDWSEYNGFIWCRICNIDYPSVMCQSDHDKAIKTYLECVLNAKNILIEDNTDYCKCEKPRRIMVRPYWCRHCEKSISRQS